MELDDVLKLDISNLANRKYEALKQHTIDKLNEIISLLKEDKLQAILNQLGLSDAGDGWGDENYYINFSYTDRETMDLAYILFKMAELKNIELSREEY